MPLRLTPGPEPPKGGLERVLGTLDRPGKVVRALVSGQFGLAGKNLLNFAEELPTLGLYQASDLPGSLGDWFKRNVQTTRQEDKSLDWGFVGNVATDPLSVLTLGGAGAAAGIAKAGAKEGAKKLALNALKSGLTKAGRGEVEKRTALKLTELMARKSAAKIPEPVLKRVAERQALTDMLKATPEVVGKTPGGKEIIRNTYKLAEDVAPELVEQGGIKFGLPLTRGVTIPGTAGKNALAYHPAYQTVKYAAKVPLGGGKTIGSVLGDTFLRGHNLGPREAALLQGMDEEVGSGITQFQNWMAKEIEPLAAKLSKEDMLDLWAAKQGFDPRIILRKNLLGLPVAQAVKLTPELRAAGKAGAEAARVRVQQNPILKQLSDAIEKAHVEMQASEKALGIDQGTIPEYLRRLYSKESPYLLNKADEVVYVGGPGIKGFTKGRKFEDIADAIEAGLIPDINPLKALESRAEGSIRLKAVTKLAKRQAVGNAAPIAERAAPAGAIAEVLNRGVLPERGVFPELIHKFNQPFKRWATSGLGPLANPAFVVRNVASGQLQHLLTEGGQGAITQQLKGQTFSVLKNLDKPEALRGKGMLGGHSNLTLEEAAKALRDSNLARNTFAQVELLTKSALPKTRSKLVNWMATASERATQASESWMRASHFLNLLKQGHSSADAARLTNRALVDYRINSGTHRLIRDLVPFSQFQIGTLPPLLETIARRPRFMTPVREVNKAGLRAEGTEDRPVMPAWMAAQPTIPVGKNAAGQRKYLTSMGTLFDVLNTPQQGGVGATLERSLLGQLTPPVKVLGQVATQRDFFFRQPLNYDKTPAALQAVGFGPTMNPAGRAVATSLPFTRQMSTIDTLVDSRKDWLDKAIGLLTGAKVFAVDEEKELRRIVKTYLEERVAAGDVRAIVRYQSRSLDPQLGELIKQFHKVAKRKKAIAARAT